ncbi:cytochrome P450 [Lentzea sp. NPDC006480]|uniref:cytochrome P450 family protein n=1 Tax=Lentzea sp. NPDC006480 TaxID=3157176 RepID=UPI0033B086F7
MLPGELGVAVSAGTLFSKQYFRDPAATLHAVRELGRVHQAVLPNKLPVWVVTSHDDARVALTDDRVRKSSAELSAIMLRKLEQAGGQAELSAFFSGNMLVMDPPDHTRLRKLLARDFTAKRMAALRPRIEQIAAELLDALPTAEPVDLIAAFAFRLPMIVICDLLGVPEEFREPMRDWSQAMMGEVAPDEGIVASRRMTACFSELIRRKRAEPGDDLLSALTRASDDGDQLTEAEVLSTAILLVVAGHETTVNLIGSSAEVLLRDHETRERLVADPDLIPKAVEELLRLTSPLSIGTTRYTAAPIAFGDVEVPAGEILLVSLAGANRDPERFEQPDDVDLERGAGHLAFGHGIHYCIGAPLARMEGEIALRELLRRFPRYAGAVPAEELRRRRSYMVSGFRELPVILSPEPPGNRDATSSVHLP